MIDSCQDDHEVERRQMVERIEQHFSETRDVTGMSRMREELKEALLSVPRHRFVDRESERLAYADSALAIGHGQTISQPFIVALMIELAELGPEDRVLEIGTGSGYDAAILASLVREVYTLERVPELAESAKESLVATGCDQVQVRCGDGFEGWPEAAPFDAILVTACSPEVPAPLVSQLATGGRMVIPVGAPRGYQELQVIEKTGGEDFSVLHGLPVAFVPLVHFEASESSGGD